MTKARDIASAIPAPSTVSSAELGFLDGVTSAIQTQVDAKAPSSTAVTLTGTQTLTNKTLTSPVIASVVNNTLTSTTGDIIYASAANTPARLGIGSTSQVLTVASGIPSWAAPAAAGFVGCRIKKSGGASQNISNATTTTITWNAEDFDTDTFHDNATNNTRITIPSGKGGKYLFTATGHWADNTTGSRQMYLRKNGTDIVAFNIWGSDGAVGFSLPQVFELIATDYIELVVFQDSTTTIAVEGAYLFLAATYLGA